MGSHDMCHFYYFLSVSIFNVPTHSGSHMDEVLQCANTCLLCGNMRSHTTLDSPSKNAHGLDFTHFMLFF